VLVVVVLLWLLVLVPLVYWRPGAGLLIWPTFLARLLLLTGSRWPQLTEQLTAVVAVLSVLVMGTLLVNLPIALGVAALPMTAVLVAWTLALFVHLFRPMRAIWQALALLALPLLYLLYQFAQEPAISPDQPHPTSLSYLFDHDSQQGYYFNYDVAFSGWHDDLFATRSNDSEMQQFRRQYRKPVRHLHAVDAPITLPAINTEIKLPLKQGKNRQLEVIFSANPNSDVLEVFALQPMTIHRLVIEGRKAVLSEPLVIKTGQRWLHYHFDGKKEIKVQLEMDLEDQLNWQLQTHSSDLLEQEAFGLKPRPAHQIQKPFIKSDNTLVVQSLAFDFDH